METTKYFGEYFRKRHENWKMMKATSVIVYLQIYTKIHK